MSSDELSRLWKSQSDGLPTDLEEVLMDVQKRSRTFRRKILLRDTFEGMAALQVSVTAWVVSYLAPGWLPIFGAVVLTALCGWVCWRLHRTRRAHPKPSPDSKVVDRLRAEIEAVEAQSQLLRSVRSWYVTPLAIGGVVWATTLVPAVGMPAPWTAIGLVTTAALSGLLMALVGWGVIRLNRHAVRTKLDPYQRELEELLDQMASA